MNKKNLIVIVVSVGLAMFFSCNQTLPEDVFPSPKKLEIISIQIPYTIVFKPAVGVQIPGTYLSVFLVSETKSYKASIISMALPFGTFNISDGLDDFFYFVSTNKDTLRATNFKVPADFKAKKIKFVVSGKNMIFDLDKYEWE